MTSSADSPMKRVIGRRWIIAGLLAFAAGTILAVQRRIGTELRSEVELLRVVRQHEVARLQSENRNISSGLLPNADLERLRVDHAAVVRLRGEIDALKAREQAPAELPRSESVALAAETPADAMIPAHDWKNVGRATPAAAVETALWAAAGGELNTLAGMMYLNTEGRAKVESAPSRVARTNPAFARDPGADDGDARDEGSAAEFDAGHAGQRTVGRTRHPGESRCGRRAAQAAECRRRDEEHKAHAEAGFGRLGF